MSFLMFFSFLLIIFNFKNKLIFLLSLEIMIIFVISLFFFSVFKNLGVSSFLSSMIFLIFMVMDSVLGISLLILSSRCAVGYFPHFNSV